MNKLPIKMRERILQMLCEGSSLRAAARMADVSHNTVEKLLRDVGSACLAYQDENLRNLPCKRVQFDEIWSFAYVCEKNLPERKRDQFGDGDIWTWTAIDAETKLVPCWHVGNRTIPNAKAFIGDLAARLDNCVQLSTVGHKPYLSAGKKLFGEEIDCAYIVKLYGAKREADGRLSAYDNCTGIRKNVVAGVPNEAEISTRYTERQNLTMRTSTRFTNAHSKRVENHMYAVSLHFMHYNFARIHQRLRITPAMAASMTDHVWTFEEIASLDDGISN